MDKLVILVERGMVQSVYASRPGMAEAEVIDLDVQDMDALEATADRLQEVRRSLYEIY